MTYTFKPKTSYLLRVEKPASANAAAASSRTLTVQARPGFSDVLPATMSVAVRGLPKTVTGRVHPDLAGRPIRLEQLVGTTWTTVAQARIRTDGRFDLRFAPAHTGTHSVRAVMPASPGLASRATTPQSTIVYSSQQALEATKPACLGAAAISGCQNPALAGLALPTTEHDPLYLDVGRAYECWTRDHSALVRACAYGELTESAPRIALVGDSHAASYFAGLAGVLHYRHVRMDTYLGRFCRWGDALRQEGSEAVDCRPRTAQITRDLVRRKYDLVVVSTLRHPSTTQADADADAKRFSDEWKRVAATGATIVAIRDFPYFSGVEHTCLTNSVFLDALRCAFPRSEVMRGPDAQAKAVELTGAPAHVLDLDARDQLFCRGDVCPMVTGNEVMYRDRIHISATYSRSIASIVMTRIQQFL